MDDQHDRALAFRALHDRDAPPLRLLNAWDAGSAKVLVAAGAPALGTTSAGIAFALGLPDGERLTRDAMLAAVRAIATAVTVPVSADLEAGYADEPDGVAETVRLALDAGAVGFNLEDGRVDGSLTPVAEHAARVRAAADAVRAAGIPAFINARTDAVWLRAGDEAETIARLRAYAEAGADGGSAGVARNAWHLWRRRWPLLRRGQPHHGRLLTTRPRSWGVCPCGQADDRSGCGA